MKQLELAVDQPEIVTQTIETAVRKLSTLHLYIKTLFK